MEPLRAWQASFLERFKGATIQSFLLVACPGAGKTRAAVEASSVHDHVLVVAPSVEIKAGWARAFREAGRKWFDPTRDGWPPAKDASVIIITYAGIATYAPEIRAWLTENGIMILDEIHHSGETDGGPTTWAKPILMIGEATARNLLLTGTPVRTGGDRMPFVEYDDGGEMIVHFRYGFREAWADDPSPIRFPRFHSFDVIAKWKRTGKDVETTDLSEADDNQEGSALAAALEAEGALALDVVRHVYDDVMARRASRPRAAGLFICRSQHHARALKAMMKREGFPAPALIISDTDASHSIDDFRASDVWAAIVVRMITEGVDVPRCEVLGYLTNYRTPLFFHQAVGRVLRTTTDRGRRVDAVIHYPASPALDSIVDKINEDMAYALRDRDEAATARADSERPPSEIEFTENYDSHEVKMVMPGQSDIDAGYIEALQEELPHLSRDTLADVAAMLKRKGTLDESLNPTAPPVFNVVEDSDKLRKRLDTAVKRLAGARAAIGDGTFQDHVMMINATFLRRFGVAKRAQMTDDQMREAIRLCRDWLADLYDS